MSNSLPQSLVLIGAGKMGGAMLEGWLRIGIDPKGISLIDPKPSDEMVELAQEKGMRLNPSAKEIPPPMSSCSRPSRRCSTRRRRRCRPSSIPGRC